MTHPAVTTPQAAATYYRQACGWSARAAADMVWLRASHPVEALRMPAPVGARVRDALRRAGTDGPLFTGPGHHGPLWTFLTRPRRTGPDELAVSLAAHGIDHFTDGHYLDLPPTAHAAGGLHWLTSATGPPPEYRTLATAALGVVRSTEGAGRNRAKPAGEVGALRITERARLT